MSFKAKSYFFIYNSHIKTVLVQDSILLCIFAKIKDYLKIFRSLLEMIIHKYFKPSKIYSNEISAPLVH